ncbi:MAG: putative bifunctional diguanylate cyclase/phosphodiesterase [Vicinamibacterales bacterium]
MAAPIELLRPRRRGQAPEPLRLVHLVVGAGDDAARALGRAVVDAGAGRVSLESVVGLGRGLDRLRARPAALVLLQARSLDLARIALAELKRAHPALPVVVVSDAAHDEAAIAAVRAGAEDCVAASAGGTAVIRAALCALERTSHAATLRTQAVTDTLTGLPNRQALQTAIEHAMARARRHARTFAVLFVDLDGFKAVNDRYGHDAGDRVLQALARRFAGRTRDMDTVARVGGDEFVVVMEDLDDGRFAATVAAKLVAAAAEPIDLDGTPAAITASIGISLFPGDGVDAGALLRHADQAMYAAKDAGKSRFCYYRARMNEHSRARTALGAALDRAFAREEFELHFQPVWRASRRRISSCEALVRWRRPGHGVWLPDQFLEAAEQAGLAARFAAWTIGEACRTARTTRDAGFDVPISVNLSRRQIVEGDLAGEVARALRAAGVPPSALRVELSEAVIGADDPAIAGVLDALAALGVAAVVDDAGSGVASLRVLSRMRAAGVKIDGGLAREASGRRDAAAMAGAIVALARALGIEVSAGGVETEAQASALRALGCDDLQGYFYGHALPGGEWLAYLRWACTAVVGTDGAATPPRPVRRRPAADLPRLPGAALPGRGRGDVVIGSFRKH